MLPTAARDMLSQDQADADALAARGQASAGYERLQEGLRRAEDPRYAGQSWQEELRQAYRDAIADYAAQHGLG